MMEYKQEQKNDNNPNGPCKATQTYSAKRKLYYIEKNVALTEEHVKMYNALRFYVDSVLSKKEAWGLSKLPLQLLALVDTNKNEEKHNDSIHIQATQAMYIYLSNYATEVTLIRAITGSDYRINIAQKALLETVQWRVSSRVDEISPLMFEKSIKTKVVFSYNQHDKKGHIICYFKVLEIPPEDPWQIVRAAVWTIEKAIKMSRKRGIHQIMWLLDIEHLQYATVPPLQILKEIAHILQY
eukprot:UN03020